MEGGNVSRFICIAFIILLPGIAFGQSVLVAKLDGAINPASAAFVKRSIERAKEKNGECLIVELNTPGGLLESTRNIVGEFLESKIPIIVYVAPAGARAGSAGVFVTMAAHIAAMAPGTNIGAAHPVDVEGKMDSVMSKKVTNDAAAFIRSIAEKRNRNLNWAEEAVRESRSITETEALDSNVIDLIAKNLDDLLTRIDGRQIKIADGTVTLHVKDAHIETLEMGWTERFLDIVSDPNFLLIFIMLGSAGLLLELYNPGSILPGIVGVISYILAFYSMHVLPINFAGFALITFAIILFLLEIKIVSHGMLAVGGAVSLLLGSIMLVRPSSALEFAEISWFVVVTTVVISTIFFAFLLGLGLKVQRRKPTTGVEGLIGEVGEAYTPLEPEGTVRIHGEFWHAESAGGNIAKGERVRVTEIHNLMLKVERTK